jgi:hypothetical protein
MGRAPGMRRVLAVLAGCAAACAAACDDAPPEPTPPDVRPASVSPDPVPPPARTDEHPYLVAYREEMRLVLRPERAAELLEVDTEGTESLDERRLALLAADRSLRVVLPLVLDAAGMRTDARRLRDLAVIEDASGARAAQRVLGRVVSRIEQLLRNEVEEPPFPGRRALHAARLAGEIAAPLADEGAEPSARPEDARRVSALLSLSFEAYRSPEELALVEPLAVQLFRDLVALARGGTEPIE